MKTEREIRKRLSDAKEVLAELEGCYDFISGIARTETEETIRILEWVLKKSEETNAR